MPRQLEGTALLIAGHGAPGVGAFDAAAVHTLGQIGEALLATGAPWHVRRLTATTGDRYAADRKTIKRSLATLIDDPVRVGVIVLLGEIVEIAGELALVTGAEAHEYPEDATLPLTWIRDRIARAKAEHLVVAVSARGLGTPARWLGELGTQHPHHVVAIDAPANDANPMIDALLAGLCGDALDPQTGTVTMASLSKHLTAHARAVQASSIDETVAHPPPLAGLWDVRRSQLANRPRPPAGEPEDLAGIVLPGRFRIDKLVARGTFGTVYRARQLAVERDVAVKVLHAEIDPASEDGKLFVHEIRSVGRIDHANVVRIYQADITHDGRLFFAMELLDGSDLQSLGAAGRLPKERAVELVLQLLAGLGAAHDAGLVHADIKPANAIVIPARTESRHLPPAADAQGSPATDAQGSLAADAQGSPGAAGSTGEAPKPERAVLVDFGLARLRAPVHSTRSAGGTPAYMAPEQLHDGRIDARSDLFSLALVLVWLLTGWRRPNAYTLVPPRDLVDDPQLREILARALHADPAKRFQSARDFSAALAGAPAQIAAKTTQDLPQLPFRHLAPLTEADRGRLHGREADVALITEHALYRRVVVYAAPSGTGKTSVLRAGLLPRLEALGIHAVYVRCRTDFTWSVVKAIAPGATSIADAITKFHEQRGGKLVLVVDQLEAALADPELVPALLRFDQWPTGADVSIVLAIREDWLARLLARTQEIEPNLPIVRLPPLSPDGARTAIVAPLTEHRLAIEPELLDVLLTDLQRAAEAIGPEMGWGDTPAVFPPHLQLACSVLHESMAVDDATLTLQHYRKLGGFDAIVGEHLDRVIETELDDARALIARALFLALVTGNQRAIRPESELLSIVGAKHGADRVTGVLEVLRSKGLLVRVRADGGASWELIHDSLVARVLAWIDRKDLARRRAIEQIRYHLRRSTVTEPSLLGRRELRELRPHAGAVEELDAEWSKREAPDIGWTPSHLVARSRRVLRRTVAAFCSLILAALLVGGAGFYRSSVEAARASEMERLKALDLGRFTLALELFDWDPVALRTTTVAAPPELYWRLHAPDPDDVDQAGSPYDPSWIVRGTPHFDGLALVERIEARGGRAYLVIDRAGCSPSTIPLRQLPGYTRRDDVPPTLRLRVPTCQASRADMIEIPAGRFIYGGLGDPPSPLQAQYAKETVETGVELEAFSIDRLEVTNGAFLVFASMAATTGVVVPAMPATNELGGAVSPRRPLAGIDWTDARGFCRFLGKELPTSKQWVKAMRGGEIVTGQPNPFPRRNFPWGVAMDPLAAGIAPATKTIPDVGSHPGDVSPYGVLDLAGSLTEWTDSRVEAEPGIRIVRGGNWSETTLEDLVDFMATENRRAVKRAYALGMRCARAGL